MSRWFEETDQELLDRHRAGNVIGIDGREWGESYWQTMESLQLILRIRNLI